MLMLVDFLIPLLRRCAVLWYMPVSIVPVLHFPLSLIMPEMGLLPQGADRGRLTKDRLGLFKQ